MFKSPGLGRAKTVWLASSFTGSKMALHLLQPDQQTRSVASVGELLPSWFGTKHVFYVKELHVTCKLQLVQL